MGVGEIGIERKRLFEQIKGCDAVGTGALVHVPEAALTIIPGAHVLGPFGDYALALGTGQRRLDRGGDTRGDIVLHREYVGQIPVVTLGPEMGTGGCIDKLAADAHPLSGPAQATLEDIADTKVAADLLWVDGFSFIGECRIAGDDKKPAPFRQRCDDVLGNAVDKILLLGITTDIVKRKNSNRRSVEQRRWRRVRRDRRSLSRLCEKSAIGADRPGDILDLLFAHVLKRYGKLIAHLIAYHPADADAAWFGQGLQAGRHVDTVTEDVVVVDHDVGEIDADAKIDAPLGWHAGVTCDDLALHLDRAANRIDYARKFAKQTIARRVDDAAAVLLNFGVGNVTPQRLQRRQRAFLIRRHQA